MIDGCLLIRIMYSTDGALQSIFFLFKFTFCMYVTVYLYIQTLLESSMEFHKMNSSVLFLLLFPQTLLCSDVLLLLGILQMRSFEISSRKRDRDRERANYHPYKVTEISPPPKSLGVRCFPPVGDKHFDSI